MSFKVSMKNVIEDANGVTWTHEATDTVPAEQIDDYLTDAQTRWSEVTYSEIPD